MHDARIKVTASLSIHASELIFTFIRSPGPGGQNVNKVATTAVLRFNVQQCAALSDVVRRRLLILAGSKLTSQGELIIKASRFRTQERNKQDAQSRLIKLLQHAAAIPKKRTKTKPSYASIQERLSSKKRHGKLKSLRRRKPTSDE